MLPSEPSAMTPGRRQNSSQIEAPLPSAAQAPSIWKALLATPQTKLSGKRPESSSRDLRSFIDADFSIASGDPSTHESRVQPAALPDAAGGRRGAEERPGPID